MRYITFLILAFALLTACEEVCVDVKGPPPPPPPGERKVLIEEFTGIRCVNCPAGSQAIEALIEQHGDRLIAVSIHAGFFSQPVYAETQQDLATDEGAAILSYLTEPLGYPSAVVNRKLFSGEEALQIGQSSWAGHIAQELAIFPSVGLDIEADFNDVSRDLSVNVDMTVLENVSAEDIRLSVYITENNIIDAQYTPSANPDVNYVHKHVFRKAMTSTQGDILNESFVTNATFSRNFNFTLPAIWEASNCHVVAFVHYGGSSLEVLQAEEISITE